MHRFPEYGRLGDQKLPKCWRALRGWKLRAPGSSRRPWPLAFWAAIAWRLIVRQEIQMAIFLLMALSTYCRPHELMGLRRKGLLPPVRGISKFWGILLYPSYETERTKTGLADVSILLDSVWLRFLDPVYKVLNTGDPEEVIWTFQYPAYLKMFKLCLQDLGVQHVVIPYQTRHSGPSIDVVRKYRPVSEAQRRGQWASIKSVQRYEKSGRLSESWELLQPWQQEVMQLCETHLEDFVYGREHGVVLPYPVVTSKAVTSSTSSRAS